MRAAVLFYGRLRHYQDKYIGGAIKLFDQVDFFYSADNEAQPQFDDFIRIYKPVAYCNDTISYEYDFEKYPGRTPSGTNMNNMIRHFINLKRVFGLFESHIQATDTKYDIVISVRLDLCTGDLALFTPEKNTIYIPEGDDHAGINDRIAMGGIESMKKYMNIIDNCEYLLENKLSIPHPETLTLANIKHCELNIKRLSMAHRLVG